MTQKFRDQLNLGFETFSQLLSVAKIIRFRGAGGAIFQLFAVIPKDLSGKMLKFFLPDLDPTFCSTMLK